MNHYMFNILFLMTVGVFHNHNPSNLDSSNQQIHLCWDLNLNLDYESVDIPQEVDSDSWDSWDYPKFFVK